MNKVEYKTKKSEKKYLQFLRMNAGIRFGPSATLGFIFLKVGFIIWLTDGISLDGFIGPVGV